MQTRKTTTPTTKRTEPVTRTVWRKQPGRRDHVRQKECGEPARGRPLGDPALGGLYHWIRHPPYLALETP